MEASGLTAARRNPKCGFQTTSVLPPGGLRPSHLFPLLQRSLAGRMEGGRGTVSPLEVSRSWSPDSRVPLDAVTSESPAGAQSAPRSPSAGPSSSQQGSGPAAAAAVTLQGAAVRAPHTNQPVLASSRRRAGRAEDRAPAPAPGPGPPAPPLPPPPAPSPRGSHPGRGRVLVFPLHQQWLTSPLLVAVSRLVYQLSVIIMHGMLFHQNRKQMQKNT